MGQLGSEELYTPYHKSLLLHLVSLWFQKTANQPQRCSQTETWGCLRLMWTISWLDVDNLCGWFSIFTLQFMALIFAINVTSARAVMHYVLSIMDEHKRSYIWNTALLIYPVLWCLACCLIPAKWKSNLTNHLYMSVGLKRPSLLLKTITSFLQMWDFW